MMRAFVIGLLLLSLFNRIECANLDSLQTELATYKAANDKPQLIRLYKELGTTYNGIYKHQEALDQFQKALKIAKSISNISEQFILLNHIGSMHFWMDDYPLALSSFRQARELGEGIVQEKEQVENLSKIAEVYISMGNYRKALDNQIKALNLSESINDTLGMANSLRNLGTIYYHREQYDQSLVHLSRALAIYRNTDLDIYTYTLLAALSSTYTKKNSYDEALVYAQESLVLAKEVSYPYGVAFSTGMIGTIYQEQKHYPEALDKVNEALSLFRGLGIKAEVADFTVILADIFFHQGKYQEAIDSLNVVLAFGEEIGSNKILSDAYKALSDNFASLGDTNAAFSALQQHNIYRDSLFSEENFEQTANGEMEFEIQKKEKEIILLKQKNEKAKSFLFYSLATGGLFLLSSILWMVYIRYKSQSKTNQLLALKHMEIQRQNERLMSSNAELMQFADLAGHDLKTPLFRIADLTDELSSKLSGKDEELMVHEIAENAEKLDELLGGISLYSVAGFQVESREKVDMAEAIGVATQQLPTDLKAQNARITFHDLPIVNANRRQIILLFQHLIGNAIKFKENGELEIQITAVKNGQEYVFAMRDNGKGIPLEEQAKIFNIFHQTDDPQDHKGMGIGLAICKKIIEQHGGKIWVNSEPGVGSTFFFRLPIS